MVDVHNGKHLVHIIETHGFKLSDSDRWYVQMLLGPIPMLLWCPKCHEQHIDVPKPAHTIFLDVKVPEWTNPPHKSHLCHNCGCIWRPADVPTTGVAVIQTAGKNDNWPHT